MKGKEMTYVEAYHQSYFPNRGVEGVEDTFPFFDATIDPMYKYMVTMILPKSQGNLLALFQYGSVFDLYIKKM